MAINNFTLTKDPFTGADLTDENTIYIDSVVGNDNNSGTRSLPKKTLASLTHAKIHVLRGVFNEPVSLFRSQGQLTILGEPNTMLLGSISIRFYDNADVSYIRLANLYIASFTAPYSGSFPAEVKPPTVDNCEFGSFITINATANVVTVNRPVTNTRMESFSPTMSDTAQIMKNITCDDFSPYYQRGGILDNSIITKSIELYNAASINSYFELKYCVLRHSVIYKWKGNAIPVELPAGMWNTLTGEFIAKQLRNYAANTLTAVAEKNLLNRLADNMFGVGTIVYNDSGKISTDGTFVQSSPRIFNGYDNMGNIIDYTLNRQNGNPALYASNVASYVGAYKPSVTMFFTFPAKEIDNDGVETGNEGDLLQENNGIFINIDSSQNRNRVSTPVVALPAGDGFTLFKANFYPSFSNSFYIGAKQYLTPTTSALNSILVEPYDTPTNVSAFPRFFTPINKVVEIAYHVDTNQPVLFSELAGLDIDTNKNLTEVGTMAVTNACDEWDDLISLATVRSTLPKIRYFKITLIANRV